MRKHSLAQRQRLDAVANDERKTFVRREVLAKMQQLRKLSRSKNPIQRETVDAIRDILANTDRGKLTIIAEATFQWQKKQLREFLRTKDAVSYQDMKDFIHANGWDKLWISTRRLAAYWRACARTGHF